MKQAKPQACLHILAFLPDPSLHAWVPPRLNITMLNQRHLSRATVFMPPKELWEAYSNRTVCPSIPLHVRCISPIFFEVGIPNLVCGCILGWRSVTYHFRVTVTLTLTSDLVFRIIVSGAYLLYYLR